MGNSKRFGLVLQIHGLFFLKKKSILPTVNTVFKTVF